MLLLPRVMATRIKLIRQILFVIMTTQIKQKRQLQLFVIFRTSDRIIKVDPRGKYTVSESDEFDLGKVEQIWVVASSENSMTNLSLKQLAKMRISLRGEPEFYSFNHYMAVRTSCWILEFRDGQFFGDCPI